MPKEPDTNSTAAENAELDAEFERQLAATLAMDPVERVKRLETMSEQNWRRTSKTSPSSRR